MRKWQKLISKEIGFVVSLLLFTISVLLHGQMRIESSDQEKTESRLLRGQRQAEGFISFRRGETFRREFLNFRLKKTERITTQEIRGVSGVYKQSEVLNNEVQPKNRLPVFLLFLLLTWPIWECSPKCQWIGHTEFKEKTCFYSKVSKRRGPPISAVLC